MPSLTAPVLRLVAQTGTSVTLTWTDPNPSAKGTEIQRRQDVAPPVTLATPGKGIQSWSDMFLPVPTTTPIQMTYQIRARTQGGWTSEWSNAVVVTIPVVTPPPLPLQSPVLTATLQTPPTGHLTWTDPNSQTAAISVERTVASAAPVVVASLPVGSTAWTDSALPSGPNPITVAYRVQATKAGSPASGWSNMATIITPAQVAPPPVVTGCTTTTVDLQLSTVQAAVNAAATGDVVCLPGGTQAWTSVLTMPARAMTLKGVGAGTQGQCATGGQTSWTCITMAPTYNDTLLIWPTVSTGLSRITGITWDNGTTGSNCPDSSGIFSFRGSSNTFRFDHNRIISSRCHGMIFNKSYVRGVLDNNIIEINGNAHFGAYINHGYWGTGTNTTCPGYFGGCGDRSWNTAANFGSAEFVFFEDNQFISGASGSAYATDGWAGQRVVYRYNTMTSNSFQNHGTDSSGRTRGGRAIEAYQNVFNYTKGGTFAAAIGIRGGTALVYNNTVTNYDHTATPSHYRLLTTGTPAECSFWGCCDDPAANFWDEGAGTSNGYHCMDQIGRGAGDLITGDVPAHGWPHQAAEPIYGWNNLPSGFGDLAANVASPGYVTEMVDWYTRRTTFTGTTSLAGGNGGVGSGPLSGRPATCTPFVAWWDDLNSQLYQCTATNTWTLMYTPYTYPHPIRSL